MTKSSNISNIIRSLVLSVLVLGAACQNAEAFLFPPMPGEPSFDGVNNAGKVKGVIEEGYHTGKSIISGDFATGLLGVKGLLPSASSLFSKRNKGASNTPGKTEVAANSTLKISKDSVDEEEFFNAFNTLFLNYDFSSSGIKESEYKALYDKKAEEFRQDAAINTYIVATVMEGYLATVDKTLERLEKCQNGELSGGSDCTFFGMTMEKVEAEKTTTPGEGDEDNAAQLGAAKNAYIVTTVQDRLLRMIEELTALEAVFEASRQLKIAKPIDVTPKQSSADEYVNKTYRFAYRSSHDYASAKETPLIRFNDHIKMCNGKTNDPRCPSVNKDKTEIEVISDTSVLAVLPTLENYVNNAVIFHNLKSMMYQYKTQYRQYLLQKEIHNKTKELLKNSDTCVVNFLTRHSDGSANEQLANARQIWYGGSEPLGDKRFDYANRKGLSGELLKTYDRISADIAIGSSDDCRGFYEENSCPSGYSYNKEKCCENNKSLCACEVDLITEDLSDVSDKQRLDSDPIGGESAAKINTNREDTDGLIDSTNAERIERGSRDSIELTWNLGREALLNTMKDSKNKLRFQPWNDQKILQEEYLRNKYRNIKMIIESIDQGTTAYKLASKRSAGYKNSADPVSPYITAVTSCLAGAEAEVAARQKNCTGTYESCTVSYNSGVVTTEIRRYAGSKHGKKVYTTETKREAQEASLSGNKCTYKKAPSAMDTAAVCLTPQCLVSNYFSRRWPAGVTDFYNEAHNKGRIVAMDKLEAVINEREIQENRVYSLVNDYQNRIAHQEEAVNYAIENLTTTNQAINQLKEYKNIAANELRKTNSRISSINDEINGLEIRKEKLSNKADKQSIEDKKAELLFERSCLNGLKKATDRFTKSDNKTVLTCNNYITSLVYTTEFANRSTYTYVPNPAEIQTKINEQSRQIEAQEDRLNELKNIVQKARDSLANLKVEFAEKYLEAEENAQVAIEEKNVEYERFLDPNMDDGYSTYNGKTYRMRNDYKTECYKSGALGIGCKKKGKARIKTDNLNTSITTFIQGGDLKGAMKKELNNTFFSSITQISDMLSRVGVPSNFYVDDTFKSIGISGNITPMALAVALKDAVVEMAAEELKNTINQADSDIQRTVDEAASVTKTYSQNNNVDGQSNKMPSDDYLLSPAASHMGLLKDLQNISNRYANEGIDNLFGIPQDFSSMADVSNNVDDSYFVALPARGNNYNNKREKDVNAGRDFIAPKNMLSSLPPLREVFYFNAADYEDFAKDKKGRPVITELLRCKSYNEAKKVCETEYLPEVWLYLLASPNLREDHKYWQTFVERSFGGKKQLNKLVQNQIATAGMSPSPKDTDYRAIIARSGIYPCKTANGEYIDISGGDNISNMQFKIRSSLPVGVSPVTCQEVALSGKKIRHLLADSKLNLEGIGTTNEPMYERHSELGQLLTTDLRYRPLQENIQKFLLNTIDDRGRGKDKASELINNVARQKAERASFKRNVMGSFLDAMTTEYNARKSLEQSKKTMAETLQSLCTEIDNLKFLNNNRPTISGCAELSKASDISEIADVDKITIVDTMRLADTYDADRKYYEGGGNYSGINCALSGGNMYKQIFCMLDAGKNSYIAEARKEIEKVNNIFNKNANGSEYIMERLNKINGYIGENGSLMIDNNEVTTIRPNVTPAIETARADRDVEIQTAEEGLGAMANQSQVVAYCPIY